MQKYGQRYKPFDNSRRSKLSIIVQNTQRNEPISPPSQLSRTHDPRSPRNITRSECTQSGPHTVAEKNSPIPNKALATNRGFCDGVNLIRTPVDGLRQRPLTGHFDPPWQTLPFDQCVTESALNVFQCLPICHVYPYHTFFS